ncbi:MAG: RecX family transcriptional regulator [Clostridiales bacterium]|nr:RecX family transcriptional regulator [Clostridiales bacterium]
MNRDLQYSDARNQAIAHIGIAVSSSGKIREFLEEKGYVSDVIEDVIEQLTEEKYVDDARYARKILRARSGSKAEGRLKLQARLEAAGVAPDVISDVLSEPAYADENTIMEVIRDRFPASSFSTDPSETKRQLAKAIRYLESRGYSSSLALSSFRNLLNDVE